MSSNCGGGGGGGGGDKIGEGEEAGAEEKAGARVSSECDAGAELIDRSGGTSVMCSCSARYVIVVVVIIVIAPAPVIAGGHESNEFEMTPILYFYTNSHWLSQV